MANIFAPPPPVTISGDYETISRFLNNPTFVPRRLRTLAEQRLVAGTLLKGRTAVAGGAMVYETNEGMYADRAVEVVAPGSAYPLTPISTGPASVLATNKWGQDSMITDEAVVRERISVLDKTFVKMVNSAAKNIDSIALSAIASSVSQTSAVGTAWSAASGATILRDILTAVSNIRSLNQGYEPNALVVNDAVWANLASDPVLINALRRETSGNAVYDGAFDVVAGLQIVRTPNLPASGAWIIDTTYLGGLATESLGGGYQSAGDLLESKTIRDDDDDCWRIRVRSLFAPYIIEPNAAWKLTGV